MEISLRKRFLHVVSLSIMLESCMLSAGTHGSIKAYQYPFSKFTLDSAVQNVIALNPNIQRDTTKDYYNDGHNYVTINIKQPDMIYEYTFRYYGDSTDWNTSPGSSELFICYAWDQNGNGGSEGNGGVTWYHWILKRRLLKPFETEFISKLDSILKVKHTNPD
jgi:hypothetical protein